MSVARKYRQRYEGTQRSKLNQRVEYRLITSASAKIYGTEVPGEKMRMERGRWPEQASILNYGRLQSHLSSIISTIGVN